MCWCNPSIRTIQCGRTGCHPLGNAPANNSGNDQSTGVAIVGAIGKPVGDSRDHFLIRKLITWCWDIRRAKLEGRDVRELLTEGFDRTVDDATAAAARL